MLRAKGLLMPFTTLHTARAQLTWSSLISNIQYFSCLFLPICLVFPKTLISQFKQNPSYKSKAWQVNSHILCFCTQQLQIYKLILLLKACKIGSVLCGLSLTDHAIKTAKQLPADFMFFPGSYWMGSEDCSGPICLCSSHLLLDRTLWCPCFFYACPPAFIFFSYIVQIFKVRIICLHPLSTFVIIFINFF